MSYHIAEGTTFNGTSLDIGEKVELSQLFNWKELFGWEAKNKYSVKTSSGGKGELYIAEDEVNQCQRQCLKAGREWDMSIYKGPSPEGEKVLKMHKDSECCFPCCGATPTPCCDDRELVVTTPRGEQVASASAACFRPCSYNIPVVVGEEHKYTIEGSLWQCGFVCPCCADAELDITTADGEDTGGRVVRPQLSCAECLQKTNRMEITFPEDAGDDDKAGVLGGAMLFEILEEIKEQQNEDNSGN